MFEFGTFACVVATLKELSDNEKKTGTLNTNSDRSIECSIFFSLSR